MPAANAQNIAPGEVRTIYTFENGIFPGPSPSGFLYVTTPEGITSDRQGNLYVGRRSFTPVGIISVIVKIDPDGMATDLAALPLTRDFAATGVLGLAADPTGAIYAAHNTGDPATSGVYRVAKDGSAVERLGGSQGMIFPNALTFDARGNLYATDHVGGAVWRFPKDGSDGMPWVSGPLFAPFPPTDPTLPPLGGANGIAFFPPNTLYFANTSGFFIGAIDIQPDGSGVTRSAPVAGVFVPDGIAVDAKGNVYVASPPGALSGTSTVVKVDPATGVVSDVIIGPGVASFNLGLSLTFGQGQRNQKSVYVTSSGLFGPIPGLPDPGIVEVGVGEPGFKGR